MLDSSTPAEVGKDVQSIPGISAAAIVFYYEHDRCFNGATSEGTNEQSFVLRIFSV